MSEYELEIPTQPEAFVSEDPELSVSWGSEARYDSVNMTYIKGPVRISVSNEGPPFKVQSNVPIRYDEAERTIYFVPPKP